jgi:hypothetical protein
LKGKSHKNGKGYLPPDGVKMTGEKISYDEENGLKQIRPMRKFSTTVILDDDD